MEENNKNNQGEEQKGEQQTEGQEAEEKEIAEQTAKQQTEGQQKPVIRSKYDKASIILGLITLIYFLILIFNTDTTPKCPLGDDFFDSQIARTNSFDIYTEAFVKIGYLLAAAGIILGIKGRKKADDVKTKACGLKLNIAVIIVVAVLSFLTSAKSMVVTKPVIYLYPQKEQTTSVQLFFKGKLGTTYPKYDDSINGWKVKAYPDGKLINLSDNKEYSYLFWDGIKNDLKFDMSKGFAVEGKDTQAFLQDTLSKMGLTPKEYNEFIVYWLPLMENNKYNIIHFADSEYTDSAPLKINPQPDSMLRVFMVYKACDKKVDVTPQEIKPFERKGFSVVEWGGTELK